jgi:hypothetical protein
VFVLALVLVVLPAPRALAGPLPGRPPSPGAVRADEPAVTVSPTDAQAVNDRSATRTINLIIAGLTLLGFGMLAATIWTWRVTKPLKPQLEGLDLLAQRRWHRASVDTRAAILDDIRAVRGPLPEPDISPSTADLVTGPPMPVAPGSDDTSHGYGDIATVQPVPLPLPSPLPAPLLPAWPGSVSSSLLAPPPSPSPSPSPVGWVEAADGYGGEHG